MISDEQLEDFTSLFHKIMDEGGVKRPDLLWLILQELKQRRESALRPATKYLGTTLREQFESIKREVKEVEMAMMYNDTDDHLLEELVDVQTACETMMAIIGADESARNEVRRQVIEKNRRRGYYEGERK